MPKYATGLEGKLYVVTTHNWGKSQDSLVAATDLKDAKNRFGYTRQDHTTHTIRRATWEDVDRLGGLSQVRSQL